MSFKKEILEQNLIMYELDIESKTASIIKSPKAGKTITIPTSILFESETYTIVKINREAFQYNQNIQEIQFEGNSKLRYIDKDSFLNSSLESLSIPGSVKKLEDGFGSGAYKLTDIKIDAHSDKIQYRDKKFLVYDETLVFVRRDIEKGMISAGIKRIAERSFDSCYSLSSLSFQSTCPDSSEPILEEICPYSFYYCSNLAQLQLPSSLKKICSYAFYNCSSLVSITFLEDSQLESIGKSSFYNSRIQNLTIPSLVNSIEEGFLYGINTQITLKISEKNRNFFTSNNNFIISKNILLFAHKSIENAVIPSSIIRIAEGAFDHCKDLLTLSFEKDSKIIEIGQMSFCYCSSLKEIEIPSTIKCIDGYAFRNCTKLENVIFKPTKNRLFQLKTIKSYAFMCCTSLIEITIPSSLEVIGQNAFVDCEKLTKVTFSKDTEKVANLRVIDDYAFSNCSNLTEIQIPASVNKIGRYAFNGCKALKNIEIPKNSELESIGMCAFYSTQIDNIMIPSKVSNLDESCFFGMPKNIKIELSPENKSISLNDNSFFICNDEIIFAKNEIKKAVVPKNVKKFGKLVFYSCLLFESVSFDDIENSELIEIGDYSFQNCRNLKYISPMPKSLSLIGDSCFKDCQKVAFIEFLSSEFTMSEHSFESCESLFIVSFPNAQKINVGYQVFIDVAPDFAMFTIPFTVIRKT